MSDWLPDLILMQDSNNDWESYCQQIYSIFSRDFVNDKPRWCTGQRVSLKRHPEYDGKSATFWHMVSEGNVESERTPDLRRCERIAWVRACMEAFDNQSPISGQVGKIVWWKEKRGSEERYLLSLTDFSYIVVIADRKSYVLPWTAYCVEYEHQRRKLGRKYKAYWNL